MSLTIMTTITILPSPLPLPLLLMMMMIYGCGLMAGRPTEIRERASLAGQRAEEEAACERTRWPLKAIWFHAGQRHLTGPRPAGVESPWTRETERPREGRARLRERERERENLIKRPETSRLIVLSLASANPTAGRESLV